MAHGDYQQRRRGSGHMGGTNGGLGHGAGVRRDDLRKHKASSVKNQIRSIERLLRRSLPPEIVAAQEKKLEELKKIQDVHARSELERKLAIRYRRVKFFERRKIERSIRRVEKQQRALEEQDADSSRKERAALTKQLVKLKDDLEYIKFFPKTEKYVSLFVGDDDEAVVKRRSELRAKVKANLAVAAAAGVDLEEGSGSEDDGLMEVSEEDDFFLAGSSSDDADADDEWDDKSPRDDTSREAGSSSPGRGGGGSKRLRAGGSTPEVEVETDPKDRRRWGQVQAESSRGGMQHQQHNVGGRNKGPSHSAWTASQSLGGSGGRPRPPLHGRGGGTGGARSPLGLPAPTTVQEDTERKQFMMPPPKDKHLPRKREEVSKRAPVPPLSQAGPSHSTAEEKHKRKRTRAKKKNKH